MTNFDVVSTFIQTFLSAIDFGYTAIQPSVNFIMAGLITILITITAGLTWLFGDLEGMIKGLIGKIVVIGFILLLVQHWESYTNDVDVGLTQLGLKAGGLNETANTFLQSPQTLATQGFLLCRQICAQADAVPGGFTERWLAEFEHRLKWNICLNSAMMPGNRRDDDEAYPP